MHTRNIDPHEVHKFDSVASRWWDAQSEFKPLHDLNPLRVGYIDRLASLHGKRVLDVGCGGGLLTEAMARCGAQVTGIDVAAAALEVAKLHLLESALEVEYRLSTAEDFALVHSNAYDVVTCMEMLEHVPDPASIVRACASMVKPDGLVFFSTLNRTVKGYALAILGAEYLLRMLPQGTHNYKKFIRPAELDTWVRGAGMALIDMQGIIYNPFTRQYSLGRDLDVNYLCAARKSA
ncbi:MAG: bifunctional 2-polyprenyl-6-hydroxyphenol methylase/3-demethylubiquinol 3-O-methyltransferase UbiG [Gammaproteobacteria bacterium]|nr:bifunctional 2-polyprenyl-6-hydroxyphenol methylase/3-demethylubiquinol 3-O-methyltransferase UbiG [Gammaproteobacteria bacterium]